MHYIMIWEILADFGGNFHSEKWEYWPTSVSSLPNKLQVESAEETMVTDKLGKETSEPVSKSAYCKVDYPNSGPPSPPKK